jgi:hypothetical protein
VSRKKGLNEKIKIGEAHAAYKKRKDQRCIISGMLMAKRSDSLGKRIMTKI